MVQLPAAAPAAGCLPAIPRRRCRALSQCPQWPMQKQKELAVAVWNSSTACECYQSSQALTLASSELLVASRRELQLRRPGVRLKRAVTCR